MRLSQWLPPKATFPNNCRGSFHFLREPQKVSDRRNMNTRRLLAVLITTAMALAVFSFTRVTQPAAQTSGQGSQQASQQSVQPEVPDEIAYRHLFRYVAKMRKQAEELEGRGKDATSYRTHFKRAANLSEYHARALDNIATQYLSEVQVVDTRARQVIESYRAQYADGKVPEGETPAPPPSELKQLREQRDAITLRYRDSLHSTFGEVEFSNFNNKFVKKRIAPNIRPAENN